MPSRILVVDDEPMVRALIARALTDEGYEVVQSRMGRRRSMRREVPRPRST
jgi:DNA-binding response OmpR family regulator